MIDDGGEGSGQPLECAALVAIPTFEAAGTIEATLASVEASIGFHRDTGSEDEVVVSVVDDASSDDTVSRVRSFAERSACVVRLGVQPVNRGRAAARNRAIAGADPDAVLFLDQDSRFDPDHVHACLDMLSSHPHADYVQTRVHMSDTVHRDWVWPMEASLTQNLCVRARCHQLIGGFHEEPEVEAYGCDDVLYNRTLHALFQGVRIPRATVRFTRRPRNSFDREHDRKLSRPLRDASAPASAAQHEVADAVFALQERRQAEVGRRLGGDATPAAGVGRWSAPFDQEGEPIFALMVTGKHPEREPLARGAVAGFLQQDYGNRLLVVVDDGEQPPDLSAIPAPRKRQIRPSDRRSLGELRNLALQAVPADALWTYWDDDDWYHPSRLSAQRKVLETLGVSACLLTRQVKYSLLHDIAYVDHNPRGFAGTLMSRKHPGLRFPAWAAGEDSVYLDALKQDRSWYPWTNPPHLMLRLFHGANTWDARHFGLDDRCAGSWALPDRSAEVLHQVLGLYRRQGLQVPQTPTPPHSDAASAVRGIDRIHHLTMTRGASADGGPRAVILSTGRAGSSYIAELLTLAGIRCGHEAVFHFQRWPACGMLVDSSWLALPHVEAGDVDGRVFHQVRHPLKVLSSLLNGRMQANDGRPYAHFQQAHLHGDYPDDGDRLHFAVRFVADWNRRCEQVAEQTWRVEDVDLQVLRAVAAAVDRPLSTERARQALRSTSRTTNKHAAGPPLTWNDLAHVDGADELRDQARRYGYE